jgi:hypothetical protein
MKSIVSICPTLFAAPILAKVLGYKVYCWYPKYLNFFNTCETPTLIDAPYLVPSGELITIGFDALKFMQPELHRFTNHRHIISESASMGNCVESNSLMRKNKCKVFAMPDKEKYIDLPWTPAFQFTEIRPRVRKYDYFTVSHSPRNSRKQSRKGSDKIKEVVESLGLRYELITNMSHAQAVEKKGKSHIHIDQWLEGDYKGGLGKSGLEAIMMGCAVITSGDKHKFSPPITYSKDLKNDILRLVNTWEQQVAEQDKWFKDFNTVENFKEYYR